jgi:hypothetical protein
MRTGRLEVKPGVRHSILRVLPLVSFSRPLGESKWMERGGDGLAAAVLPM